MTATPDSTNPVEVVTSAIDRAIAAISGASGGEPVEGRSADGLVTASLGATRRLERLDADPRILRGGADQLATGIVEAYHAALDAAPVRDASSRRQELAQAKEESAAAVGQLSSSLQDALRSVVTRAGGTY